MSVLETLVTVFSADTTGIKKGSKDAIHATDDVEKKIKSTNVAVDKLGAGLVNMARGFVSALAAAVSVGAVIASLKSAATETNALSILSQQTGDSVERIDAWSSAIRHAGGDAGQFQSTLVSMSNTLEDIQFNPKNASIPYFRWLGVSIRNSKGEVKSFLELLPELATAFGKLTPKQSNALGRKIGLDQSTIMLLQKGRKEVDAIIARQKELGIVTKLDAEIVAKFNAQWEDTTHAFRSLAVAANSELLPIFTKISKKLEDVARFFSRHKDVIIGGLIGIATVISYLVGPALVRMAGGFLRMAGPIGLIIGFIALLYDDLKTFVEGGDSLLGDAIKKWPILGEVFKVIGGIIFDTVGWIGDASKKIIEWFDQVADRYKKLKTFLGAGNPEVSTGAVSFDRYLKSQGGIDAQKMATDIQAGKRAINLAATSPIAAQTSNSILNTNRSSSRSVDVRTGDINIQTQATDSNGIALSINESLQNVIRGATGNFNDGVVA